MVWGPPRPFLEFILAGDLSHLPVNEDDIQYPSQVSYSVIPPRSHEEWCALSEEQIVVDSSTPHNTELH